MVVGAVSSVEPHQTPILSAIKISKIEAVQIFKDMWPLEVQELKMVLMENPDV